MVGFWLNKNKNSRRTRERRPNRTHPTNNAPFKYHLKNSMSILCFCPLTHTSAWSWCNACLHLPYFFGADSMLSNDAFSCSFVLVILSTSSAWALSSASLFEAARSWCFHNLQSEVIVVRFWFWLKGRRKIIIKFREAVERRRGREKRKI